MWPSAGPFIASTGRDRYPSKTPRRGLAVVDWRPLLAAQTLQKSTESANFGAPIERF
jgi:hypothetical protein